MPVGGRRTAFRRRAWIDGRRWRLSGGAVRGGAVERLVLEQRVREVVELSRWWVSTSVTSRCASVRIRRTS
jgi:hypothetical protein